MKAIKRTTQFANLRTNNFEFNGKVYNKVSEDFAIEENGTKGLFFEDNTLVTELSF